ncbi:MAG: NB-ARC domain-containing protein,Caspase domain-containing protein, partial [Okeania sp. SIO2D1]|nr:NB-ARC domain-containing protein,Caspase domain-containing protein [Okeania sp. SIO2D1]
MADQKSTYALVIGIDAYQESDLNREKLVNHAIDFTKWLRVRGVPAQNIFLCLSPLEDNKSSVEQLVKELEIEYRAANQQTILSLLTEELRNKEGDLLFTFWIGHGLLDSEGRRRLLFADGKVENANNLILDTLLDSQKSYYFHIQNHICIIDACASYVPESVRSSRLGGLEFPVDEPCPESKQFILFSTRKGEK